VVRRILHSPGLASCRCLPLSSNVRPRSPPLRNFGRPRTDAQDMGHTGRETLQRKSMPRLRTSLQLFLAVGLGVTVAGLSPSWLLLPAFFGCVACIIVLAIAAHTFQTPPQWCGGTGVALVLAILLLGGSSGTEIRRGAPPHAFVISLAFAAGFVLGLAFMRSAA
jgi:hypothetical protein